MPVTYIPVSDESYIRSLIDRAISAVPLLLPGEVFMVRDLFVGYEWNRLTSYIRAKVGAGFYYDYAVVEELSQVVVLGKSARNQQMYMRK